MKKILVFIALMLVITVQAQFSKYFTRATLRVDYYHSGSYEAEYYLADEVIREGKWAGPRKNLVDPFGYGSHKYEVYDSATNTLIFSRGFSTLFVEYQATKEAKSQCGNFAESIVMPFPKRTVRIEFYSRDKKMEFVRMHEMFVNPADPFIKDGTAVQFPVSEILKSGKPAKKLDLAFLPEGYTLGEMDKFRRDCQRFREYLLATDPYGELADRINIWAVEAPSEESGTDIPGEEISRNTLLGSSFNTFGSDRYLTTSDYKAVRNTASSAPCDAIVILVNHERYGGGGFYNFYALSSVDDEHSGFVFTHEFGHSFAGLGDEYYADEVPVEGFYPLDREPWEPNLTTLTDFNTKWRDLIEPGTPVPTPAIDEYKGKTGVYEGGGYMSKGIYRPYIDCSMNVVKFNHFCPVCQMAIRRMVAFYAR
jgi:hypothetical protein